MMARLGDLCDVLNGYAFKSEQYVDSGVRIIRIANVQKGYIEDSAPAFYPLTNKEYLKYELKENDLLISLTGNVGRVGLLQKDFLPAALNQRVACLRIKDERMLNKSFLFNFLNSDYFENKCIEASKGVAQKNMSTEWLKEYEIPLFPIDEQLRISNELDTIGNLISLRKQQLEKLDELVKSRFIELFGDLKSNPYHWECKSLLDVATIDTVMVSDYNKYANYPHIGIDSIEKNTGRLLGYRTIAQDRVISGKYLFTPKHIIYSKIRPNLNKVAMPNFEGLCSADAYPILPNEQVCLRIYLGYVMRSEFFLEYILPFSRRANMPKVNKEQLSGFVFPVPSIEVQKQFETFVEQTDKSKFEIQKSLNQLETLKKALMQKYFG